MDFYQNSKRVPFFRLLAKVAQTMHVRNSRLSLAIVVGTIAAVLVNYFPVLFQGRIVALLTNSAEVNRVIVLVVVYFVVMLLASCALNFANGYSRSRFTLLRLDIMGDLDRKLLTMDYPYRENPAFLNSLEAAMKSVQGNENGMELILKMLFKLPAIFISIMLMAVLIALHAPIILLGLVINVGLLFWVKNSAAKLRFKKQQEEQEAKRRIYYYSTMTSDFTFGKDIRIFRLAEMLKAGYRREIEKLSNLYTLLANREFLHGIVGVLSLAASDLLIYGSLVWLVTHGMDLATFVMLLSAATSLSLLLKDAVADVANMVGELRYVQSAYDFLASDLGDRSGEIDSPLSGPLRIEFNHVSFTYPGSETAVFEDLNFTIQAGEKIAVVGVNGAGKSTLVKLLCGLFRPDAGEILINGIPQERFTKSALYEMFSCVFQDVAVMPFDIRTNIIVEEQNLLQRGKTDADVWQALEKADFAETVRRYPKGIYQMLNKSVYDDGTNLSGGEAQKLTIARALFKDANMVIMDEPTAALDALAEQEIYKNFDELVEGKTALYISHRLASTRFCDRILLFSGKGIAEEGSHSELMQMKGAYYHMFSVQGKYYVHAEAIHEQV